MGWISTRHVDSFLQRGCRGYLHKRFLRDLSALHAPMGLQFCLNCAPPLRVSNHVLCGKLDPVALKPLQLLAVDAVRVQDFDRERMLALRTVAYDIADELPNPNFLSRGGECF